MVSCHGDLSLGNYLSSVRKCSIFVRNTPCEQFAVVVINDCQDVLGEWKYSLYLCSQRGATPQWDVISLISGS